MRKVTGPFRVYVGLVPTSYLDPKTIDAVIRDGLIFSGTLGQIQHLNSTSKTLIRPDVVAADARAGRHAYTHPEVVRGVISQVLDFSPQTKLTVTEKSADGFLTHRMFKQATGNAEPFLNHGYYELERIFPGQVTVEPLEETRQFRYHLSKGDVLTKNMRQSLEPELPLKLRLSNQVDTSAHFYESDFTIYCPKIKSSVFTDGFSGAVALGSQHRTYGAFNDLHICDMLEVCNPQLIVSDGIIAAIGGNQISQRGHELGVVLISNNAVAHDLIAAQLLNLEPLKIGHLKTAIERGWGPANPNQIELGGAAQNGIRQLALKSQYWDLGIIRLDDFKKKYERENPGLRFNGEILCGAPYEPAGTHSAVLDWFYSFYDQPSKRARISKWPRASFCVGEVVEYPSAHVVYALGDMAVESIKKIVSKVIFETRLTHAVTLKRVQFKNGRKQWLICVMGNPPSSSTLFFAFTIGSLGRMTLERSHFSDAIKSALRNLRRKWKSASSEKKPRVVLTSRMKHNSWWAMRSDV